MIIEKPTFIVNEKRVKRNIKKMVKKSIESGVKLRPHFKTHQCEEIGEWFRAQGVDSITCSSLEMARYFCERGWTDITIAIPVNVNQIKEIDRLANKTNLGVLVDSAEALHVLEENVTNPIKVWMEIDVGNNRSGIIPENRGLIKRIAKLTLRSSLIDLEGILTHAGQVYMARDKEQILEIYKTQNLKMNSVRYFLKSIGINNCKISIGDTPICSTIERFDNQIIDEIRPGNFVFYDLMQVLIGSCSEGDIAVCVACPVISKQIHRNEIIIHGGSIHLSKESLSIGEKSPCYGLIALPTDNSEGWSKSIPNTWVSSLSQEHGKIKAPKKVVESINIGDIMMILPVHSCLTANQFLEYKTLDNKVLHTFHI
ncbi:MAG: alanine racemase [Promethearchaeota archaeon]